MARLTINRANDLLAQYEADTSQHIEGRSVPNPAIRLFQHGGNVGVAFWNYAHGNWNVCDRKHGFGFGTSPESAASQCDQPATFATIADAMESVAPFREIEFQIALMRESGEFEIIEDFTAGNDDEANAYAERNYADQEWYVLHDGSNINA